MAFTLFPFGPLTDTQAPQEAALFQRACESAVPKRLLGMVYPVKEHAPPDIFPP